MPQISHNRWQFEVHSSLFRFPSFRSFEILQLHPSPIPPFSILFPKSLSLTHLILLKYFPTQREDAIVRKCGDICVSSWNFYLGVSMDPKLSAWLQLRKLQESYTLRELAAVERGILAPWKRSISVKMP